MTYPSPLYPSRFDRLLQWYRLLFPDDRLERPVQVRELNELEDLKQAQFQDVADLLVANGDLKYGFNIKVNEANGTVVVERGGIWENAFVFHMFEDSAPLAIPASATGEVHVHAVITFRVLTESTTPTLKEQSGNRGNLGHPGAHRLAYTVGIQLYPAEATNKTGYRIGVLQNNKLVSQHNANEFSQLAKELASRTFDAYGHFTVKGFNVAVQKTDAAFVQGFTGTALDGLGAQAGITRGTLTDSAYQAKLVEDTLVVSVDAGKAYPLGYPVERVSPQMTLVPKAKTTVPVTGEPYTFANLGSDHATASLVLRKTPAAQVDAVVASLTRVVTINKDAVLDDTVPMFDYASNNLYGSKTASVVQVYTVDGAGNVADEFTEGQHYTVAESTGHPVQIHWLIPNAPNVYKAKVAFTKALTPAQYRLTSGNTLEINLAGFTSPSGVDASALTGFGGATLYAPNGAATLAVVNYQQYIPRVDLVCIDKTGNNVVVRGSSNVTPLRPRTPDEHLPRAYLHFSANGSSDGVRVEPVALQRLTVADTRRMLNELDRLRHDQAAMALDQAARLSVQRLGTNVQPSSYLADPCVNFNKVAANHADSTAALYPTGYIGGGEHKTVYALTVDEVATSAARSGALAMLPFTARTPIAQPWASETLAIKQVTGETYTPMLTVSPEIDSEAVELGGDVGDYMVEYLNTNTEGTNKVSHTKVGGLLSQAAMTSTNARLILNPVNHKLRGRTLTVHGKGFKPNQTGLQLTMNGRVIPANQMTLVDSDGAIQTDINKVTASATGTLTVSFQVPTDSDGIPLGVRDVSLNDGLGKSVTALYKGFTSAALATGRLTLPEARFRAAQAVVGLGTALTFANTTLVTGLNLYFGQVDPTQPVLVQVHETVLGEPTRNLVAQHLVPGSALVASTAEDLHPVPVIFDRPWVGRAGGVYAVTLQCASTQTTVWVGRAGDIEHLNDAAQAARVRFDPALPFGALYFSPGEAAWQTDPSRKLRLDVLLANFKASDALHPDGFELVFETLGDFAVPGLNLYQFKLDVPTVTDIDGARLSWWHRAGDNQDWVQFDPDEPQVLPQRANGLQVKARLSRVGDAAFAGCSPLLFVDTPKLIALAPTLDALTDPDHPAFTWTEVWGPIGKVSIPFNQLQIEVEYQATQMGSVTQLHAYAGYWENGTIVWSSVALSTVGTDTPIEGGWVKRVYQYAYNGEKDYYALKLVGRSTDKPSDLPKVRNVVGIVAAA